jgi:hypothetical protein
MQHIAPYYTILHRIILFKHYTLYFKNRDSSVTIATGYGQDGRGSIPSRGWEFFSSPPRPDQLWGTSSQPPIQWVAKSLSPGLKRPGREADNSSPSSAEVKNA